MKTWIRIPLCLCIMLSLLLSSGGILSYARQEQTVRPQPLEQPAQPQTARPQPLEQPAQRQAAPLQPFERQEWNFNTNWLFLDTAEEAAKEIDYDESRAESVSLPHSLGEYDIFFPDVTEWQKVTWYRRHFTIPREYDGKKVMISFDGGGQINKVYVNGAYVGTAKGTFTDFSFDITDYITYGDYDNVIAVQVDSNYHRDTLPPSNDDFHWMGGLHGDVRMEIMDPLSLDSVFYWTQKTGTALYREGDPVLCKGQIQVSNGYSADYPVTIHTILRDRDGQTAAQGEAVLEMASSSVQTAEITMTVHDPNLWNTDTPYLYTVETTLSVQDTVLDSLTTRTGLRWISSTGKTAKNTALTAEDDQQILLNDQPLQLYGINRNQQFTYIGNSGTKKLHEKDAYTLKYDLGVNFVRTAHYSQDPDFFQACDEIGLLVEEEALGWNTMPAAARPQFAASVISMVKRDRNHPSIIFWSIMPNEGTEANYPVDERRQLQEAVKELDPSRLTIQEENHDNFTFVADIYANHDYVVSTSAAPAKTILRQPYIIGEWNDNLGRVFTSPYDSEERKLRQVMDDGKKLAYFMQDPTIDGIVKWDFNGYLTSLNNYKWGKTHGIYRISGVYGPFKDPLVRYWEADMMRVQTDSSIVGSVVKIMNEWKSDSPSEVLVAANAPSAELFLETADGVRTSLGRIVPNVLTGLRQGLFRWEDVVWEAGSRLIAISYDAAGQPLAEDIRYASSYDVPSQAVYHLTNATRNDYTSSHYHTYGAAAVRDNHLLQADGSDLAVVMGVLTDKHGQKLDYAYENTSFEIISGPGRLITGPRTYMLGGVNAAYLQSEYGQTGETVIQAKVDLGRLINQDESSVSYSGSGWNTTRQTSGSYHGDYAVSSAQGAWIEFTFTGTQAVLYAHLAYDNYGTGSVTIDGQPAGTILFQRGENKVGNLDFLPVYETDVLPYGIHRIRITADSAKSIAVDALKVFDGTFEITSQPLTIVTEALQETEVPCSPQLPSAPKKEVLSASDIEALLIEAEGYALEQYAAWGSMELHRAIRQARQVLDQSHPSQNALHTVRDLLLQAVRGLEPASSVIPYTSAADNEGGTSGFYRYAQTAGTWVEGSGNSGELYANKNRTPGDFVSLCFEGTGIRLYGKKDANHGIARILLTDRQHNVLYDETINMYSASEQLQVLMYENLALEEGQYQIKIMVTGETSGNPNNACVGVCSAVVYRGGRGIPADTTLPEQKLVQLKALDTSGYYDHIRQSFEDTLADADYLLAHPLVTQEELSFLLTMLEEAAAALTVPDLLPEDILPEEVWIGDEIDLTDNIQNLPADAVIELLQPVSNTSAGTFTGKVLVIFANGIRREIEIPVIIKEKTELPPEPELPFTDVPKDPDNWKLIHIRYVYRHGIMNGISGTSLFRPDHTLTRAMFATVLHRMAGTPSVPFSSRFSDVEKGTWYTDAILWAAQQNIVSGYTDGSYGIDDNITREQMAKMLFLYGQHQAYDVDGRASLSGFTDASAVSSWAVPYLQWAVDTGMISGKPNGDGSFRLDPKGEATRAECAKILCLFLETYNPASE